MIAGIGLGYFLGREHVSTPQSGVEAPRLLKRSLSRLYYCRYCVVVVVDVVTRDQTCAVEAQDGALYRLLPFPNTPRKTPHRGTVTKLPSYHTLSEAHDEGKGGGKGEVGGGEGRGQRGVRRWEEEGGRGGKVAAAAAAASCRVVWCGVWCGVVWCAVLCCAVLGCAALCCVLVFVVVWCWHGCVCVSVYASYGTLKPTEFRPECSAQNDSLTQPQGPTRARGTPEIPMDLRGKTRFLEDGVHTRSL